MQRIFCVFFLNFERIYCFDKTYFEIRCFMSRPSGCDDERIPLRQSTTRAVSTVLFIFKKCSVRVL